MYKINCLLGTKRDLKKNKTYSKNTKTTEEMVPSKKNTTKNADFETCRTGARAHQRNRRQENELAVIAKKYILEMFQIREMEKRLYHQKKRKQPTINKNKHRCKKRFTPKKTERTNGKQNHKVPIDR